MFSFSDRHNDAGHALDEMANNPLFGTVEGFKKSNPELYDLVQNTKCPDMKAKAANVRKLSQRLLEISRGDMCDEDDSQ